MGKYTVHFSAPDGSIYPREVEGEPVIIKGYEDYEFFVHDLWVTVSTIPVKNVKSKTVSEKQTGSRVGYGRTAVEAIKMAQKNLNGVSKSEFEDKLKRGLLDLSNNFIKDYNGSGDQ